MKTIYIPEDFRPKLGSFNEKKCYLVTRYDNDFNHIETYWIKDKKLFNEFKEKMNIKANIGNKDIRDGWLLDYV